MAHPYRLADDPGRSTYGGGPNYGAGGSFYDDVSFCDVSFCDDVLPLRFIHPQLILQASPMSWALKPFQVLGKYVLLIVNAFVSLDDFRTYRKNTFEQMMRIGVESLPIVTLAAAFSGMVTTVQASYQLVSPFIPATVIGSIVAPSMILELGAVVTGFILAGRVGARIAAELGTMRVTEQIDALEAMGLNSISYLIAPRILAGVIMFPMLYIAACFVGISGGILVANVGNYLTTTEFLQGARDFFRAYDAFFGLIKAFVFGFIITSISCYKGYFTSGGAEGVGSSTTQAAVMSCVFILVADLVLAVTLL